MAMNFLLLRITSIVRTLLIFITIALVAFLSIPAMIVDTSGYISFLFLKMESILILFLSGVKVHFEGLDNIDKSKVQIFASNHVSHYDVPIIYSILSVKVGWLAKKELFFIPFLGCLMKANKFISIDRGDGRKAVKSLYVAVEKVKNGNRIVIFPEGTRSQDGEFLPFKKLLFKLCLKTGVPVVPIYIEGTKTILKSGTLIIHPGDVYIKVGKEIQTTLYQPNKVLDLMNDFKESMLILRKEVRERENINEEDLQLTAN